jgi:hypothetical protein
MKIYLVVNEDRHYDPDVSPFSSPEQAIAHARQLAIKNARLPEDFTEPEIPDGWLYYARYSVESDCVWVVEKELDGESE